MASSIATAPKFVTKKDVRGRSLTLPDGSPAVIRPIEAKDRAALIAFHRKLSSKTIYMRYFSPVPLEKRISGALIAQELCNDPDHHFTLVIERSGGPSDRPQIVGIGRLVILTSDHTAAEMALTIQDDFQGIGLGAALLDILIQSARDEGIRRITANVLYENPKMLQLCKEHGFSIVAHESGGPVLLALELGPPPAQREG